MASAAEAEAMRAPKRCGSLGSGDQQVPPGAVGGGEEHGGLDDLDLISRLPDEVLGTVVSLLPINDGARTQVLSRRWLPLWLSSNAPLNLDDCFALGGGTQGCTQCGAAQGVQCAHKHNAFVSKILSDHPGPARRFKVHVWNQRDTDGWLDSGTLVGLQELGVNNLQAIPYTLRPQALLRFAATLRLLSLFDCRFIDVPASFPHLKLLILYRISEDSFQSLMSACSVLESVSLHRMECRRVCINSPTIRSISFYHSGAIEQELVIEDAPSLEMLVLDPECNRVTIRVMRAPKLEILGSLSEGISTLRIGTTVFQKMVAVSLTTKMRTMKILALLSIGPNLDSVVNLLKCFPCLQKLYIFSRPTKAINNVREDDPLDPVECLELHLKKVVLKNYDGNKRPVIDFAKFFILNAKVLEEMDIGVVNHRNDKWMRYQYRQLQVENRASRDAHIELKRDVRQKFRPRTHDHDSSMDDPFYRPYCHLL